MPILSSAAVVAIDLEHHDLHSYQGITCLMQLSTRQQDYIIDCLALRDDLHCLLPVRARLEPAAACMHALSVCVCVCVCVCGVRGYIDFLVREELHTMTPMLLVCCFFQITSNPAIVKVLHGADMDILWLQV